MTATHKSLRSDAAAARVPASDRLLLVELGGAAYEVLVPLATQGVMPNVAELLRSAALAQLESAGSENVSAAWATLESGVGPEGHGVFDDAYLDHRRRRIVSSHARARRCPTLADLIRARAGSASAVQLCDVPYTAPIWRGQPATLDDLTEEIARTQNAIRRVVASAEQVDRADAWRLLEVRFAVFDALLHRSWHLLGIDDGPGGRRQWIAKVHEAFRTLDQCLGRLLAIASRRGAAVVVVSPFGFAPFREKITLNELLRRNELLHVAAGKAQLGYRLSRLITKAERLLGADAGGRPMRGLVPVDWRRSRAIALHGQSNALVYLNTPQRFGGRGLRTAAAREQAEADVVAALTEARHPVSDEPLFREVCRTSERYGLEPVSSGWPEVIARPAPGLLVRHRLDRNGHLMRSDPSLVATRTGEGLLMVHAPDVAVGQAFAAQLPDVAPTILAMLGLPAGDAMSGRPVVELFAGCSGKRVETSTIIK